jgi:nucleoprotein TPR
LSKQIDSLKQSRAAGAAGSEDTIATLDPTSNNLQDIIRYLRQEKEIVDMQYELQIQESKRLQQQLAYAQTQLDDVREKLEAERRSNTSASEQATSHSKLMQTINELNLFRESNSSLRNEARSAQEQLARKAKEVEDLIAQLEPLKTKAREAEYELESKTGEIKLLQEDRDRWQKRTQDIMQKYDRVDPTELQELRDQITKLQEERDAAVAEKAPLQKEVNAIDEKINAAIKEAETKLEARLEAGFQERRQKLIDQSKERNRLNQATIKEKTLQLEAVTAEQNQLTAELASIKEELEVAKKARDEAVQQAESAAIAGDETEEGQLKEGGTEVMTDRERAILEALVNTAEEKAMANAERATALEQEVVVLKGNVEMLRAQIVCSISCGVKAKVLIKEQMEFEQSLATANAKAEAAQASGTTTIAEDTTGTSEELARLQADLTAAQQEVERLNANSPTTFTELGPQFDASATEQIEARIAVLKEKLEKEYADKIAEAIKAEEVKFSSRAQGMSKKLSTKLADARKDLETEMTKLKAEHQQELERIKAEPGTTAEPVAAAPIAPSEDAAPTTNGTSTNAKPAAYQPTEDEAKELLRTNNVIRNVVQGNIKSKVAAAVEEAKKEAQAERERAVQSAKELAEKRSTVQVNMAKNKANQLTAQIDVVKTAATQTPQRPVGEVWEIASKTKPGATIAPGRVSLAPGVTPAVSSAPAPARGTPVTQQIASSAPPVIAPAVQQAVPAGSQGQPQAQAPSPGTFGAPSALPQLNRRPSQSAVPSNVPTPATNPFAGTVPTAGQNQPAGAGRGTNAGTGPAALRGITNNNAAPAGTSIPRPGSSLGGPAPQQQGQAGRGAGGNRGGSQLPRAGGSQVPRGNLGNRGNPQRGGRGGLQTSGLPQLGAAAGRGGGSPQRAGRGGMNPNAQNFAPGGAGAKRPNDGSGGNEEKRVKEG